MKRLILPVFCLALSLFALAGCWGDSEPFEQKEYTAAPAQVEEISIDVRDRKIQVSASGDELIHIVYSENSKEAYDISVSDEAVLTMSGVSNKEWTDLIGGKAAARDRVISLQVPDGLLDRLALSTTNADITLSPLAVTGSATLSSNGGDISFDALDVGSSLSLSVKNGNISGTVAGRYEDFSIHTRIKKGESSLPGDKKEGEKSLQVSANNGDVEIQFAP